MRTAHPIRRRRRELALLLAAVLLAVAAFEGFLHWRPTAGGHWARYDALLGWDHKPRFAGRFRAAEFDTALRTSAQALRESEVFAPESDRFRIAVIGDSFAWGHGVEEEQRFTELLGARLGDSFEVINFAVAGYGTDQHLLKIERDVLPFEPDLLLVAFYFNDLVEVQMESNPFGVPKPRFEAGPSGLQLRNVPTPYLDLDLWVGAPEPSFPLLWSRVLRPRLVRAPPPTEPATAAHSFSPFPIDLLRTGLSGPHTLEAGVELNRLLYERIAAVAAARGIALAVVEIPFKEYFIPEQTLAAQFQARRDEVPFDRTQRELERWSRALGFVFLNPYEDLAADGGFENYYLEDRHLTARGHAILAAALERDLRASGALRAATPSSE